MKRKLIASLLTVTMLVVSPMAALAAEDAGFADPEASYAEATDEAGAEVSEETETVADDSETAAEAESTEEALTDEAAGAGTDEKNDPTVDDGSDEGEDGPGEETGGMQTFSASVEAGDSEISVSFKYTGSTEFDGRKHVLSFNPSNNKPTAESASTNPDIMIEDFVVSYNGKQVDGVTLKSCSYKNNTNPGEMYLIPTAKCTGSVPKVVKDNLKKLLSPTSRYDKEEGETVWTNGVGPAIVHIKPIELSETTEVYNLKKMSKQEKAEISKKDGILVWNGTKETITWWTRKEKEETDYDDNDRPIKWETHTYYIPTKVTVPGLYYQKVFRIKGKPVVKKINLRAGGWSISQKTFSEDGEKWTEYNTIPANGACDYYCSEPDPEGGSEEKADFLPIQLNTDGRYYEKSVKVKIDGEWDWDFVEVNVCGPGNFTGSLPDFGAIDE